MLVGESGPVLQEKNLGNMEPLTKGRWTAWTRSEICYCSDSGLTTQVLDTLITAAIHLLVTGYMGGDFLSCRLSWPGYWASNRRGIPAADRGDPLPDVSTCWTR